MCRVGQIVAGGVAIVVAGTAVAGPPPTAGPSSAPRTHGFMLYLSQPLGGAADAHARFGLRIEQVRLTGNSGAPDAGDPLQRRELIGWQMEGLHGFNVSGMKIELGSHVTYDVRHGAFGPLRWIGNGPRQTSTMSRMGGGPPPRVADLLEERSAALRNFAPQFSSERSTGAAHDSYRDSSESAAMMHEVAMAAVSTLRLSRPGLVQRLGQGNQRPLSMPPRDEAR